MKKILSALIFILPVYLSSGQPYKMQLDEVNNYLKTFDNGYYGYLEIKDGYLYDRFKDGTNYCKAKVTELDYAFEKEKNLKVDIACKGSGNCVYSTYTNQNYSSFTFSQSSNFNTSQLISLFNNLIAACNQPGTTKNTESTVNFDKYKSNIDIMSSSSSSTESSSAGGYQTALKKLNDYLKTFDNGYYGYFEVKDGYIYDRFKAGKYNKFKMEDMEGAVIQEQYSRVIFKCKGDNKCISTDWKENGKEEYSQFLSNGSYNYQELAALLNNFRDAYLGKKPTSTSSSITAPSTQKPNSGSTSVAEALKQVNDYLKTFDGDRYQGLDITDGYIYSRYKNNNYSKAKIEDIDNVFVNKEYKYIKLTCKNENKCIYSSITGSYHDYFNFQTTTGKDINKMSDLLTNFLAALKGTAITGSSGSTSNTVPARDQKAKERQKINSTKNDVDEDWDELEATAVTLNNSIKDSKTVTATAKKYQVPLQKLNEYLKTFNPGTYKGIEVKDGKVYFNFYVYGAVYNSYININELANNTIIIKGKSAGSINDEEIKIFCKGDSKCFYSTYNNSNADHFRFYSNTVKDLSKMKQLVEEFVNSLK